MENQGKPPKPDNIQKPVGGASDLSTAREMLKNDDVKGAEAIAVAEFNKLLSLKKMEDAAAIYKEFKLPEPYINKVYDRFIQIEDFKGAVEFAVSEKLPEEKIHQAGMKFCVSRIERRDYNPIPEIIKKCKLPADEIMKKIKAAFSYDINHKKYEKAAYAVEIFNLPNETVLEVVSPLINQEIQARNFDNAKKLYDKFSIPVEEFLGELLTIFNLLMQRGSFNIAKKLKTDFNLDPKHYKDTALSAFQEAIKNDNLDVAKKIMKVYNLDENLIKPIIKDTYDSYIAKKKLARALVFGKEFKVNPGILRDDAWDLFIEKLKHADFEAAAYIAETYEIPKQKVNKKVKSYYEELKQKGRNDLATLLDEQFVIGHGFLSKFFK